MKNFSLTKNSYKKTDTQPDYKMSVKIEDKFVETGSCWIKKDKNGNTFLSCKLNDLYVDHTKGVARAGFDLVQEQSQNPKVADMPEMVETDNVKVDELDF